MHVAYAAGLFDGEGNIIVTKWYCDRPTKPYMRYQLKASIGMTHYPTILAFHTRFSGCVVRNDSAHRKNPLNRIQYTWYVWSGFAYRFLKEIEPYLITKKEEALLGIEFQEHVNECKPLFRQHRGKPPNGVEIYEYRDNLLSKLKDLKKFEYDIPASDLKHLNSVSGGPIAQAG